MVIEIYSSNEVLFAIQELYTMLLNNMKPWAFMAGQKVHYQNHSILQLMIAVS